MTPFESMCPRCPARARQVTNGYVPNVPHPLKGGTLAGHVVRRPGQPRMCPESRAVSDGETAPTSEAWCPELHGTFGTFSMPEMTRVVIGASIDGPDLGADGHVVLRDAEDGDGTTRHVVATARDGGPESGAAAAPFGLGSVHLSRQTGKVDIWGDRFGVERFASAAWSWSADASLSWSMRATDSGASCSSLRPAGLDRGEASKGGRSSEQRLYEPTHFANKLCDVADMTRVVVANRHWTEKAPPVFAHLARPTEGDRS